METPLLTRWSYQSLALNRLYILHVYTVGTLWPSWWHMRFSDYIVIIFLFTVYSVLGTSLLLWIYESIYSYHCPYKNYILPMCFTCLCILPLYVLCICSFKYGKLGTSDLLVLMLFVLKCTDYKWNFLLLLLLLLLLLVMVTSPQCVSLSWRRRLASTDRVIANKTFHIAS